MLTLDYVQFFPIEGCLTPWTSTSYFLTQNNATSPLVICPSACSDISLHKICKPQQISQTCNFSGSRCYRKGSISSFQNLCKNPRTRLRSLLICIQVFGSSGTCAANIFEIYNLPSVAPSTVGLGTFSSSSGGEAVAGCCFKFLLPYLALEYPRNAQSQRCKAM